MQQMVNCFQTLMECGKNADWSRLVKRKSMKGSPARKSGHVSKMEKLSIASGGQALMCGKKVKGLKRKFEPSEDQLD